MSSVPRVDESSCGCSPKAHQPKHWLAGVSPRSGEYPRLGSLRYVCNLLCLHDSFRSHTEGPAVGCVFDSAFAFVVALVCDRVLFTLQTVPGGASISKGTVEGLQILPQERNSVRIVNRTSGWFLVTVFLQCLFSSSLHLRSALLLDLVTVQTPPHRKHFFSVHMQTRACTSVLVLCAK